MKTAQTYMAVLFDGGVLAGRWPRPILALTGDKNREAATSSGGRVGPIPSAEPNLHSVQVAVRFPKGNREDSMANLCPLFASAAVAARERQGARGVASLTALGRRL